jgi:hypothetical protein
VALDLAHVRPPAVGRQVPTLWGQVLAPEVAGMLYGARLGVGPATILATWLWWAGLLSVIGIGVPAGAVASATFHAVRVVTTVREANLVRRSVDPTFPTRQT